MLAPRTETILKSIVGQYITRATPVPSQSITNDCELKISSATIRNEMAHLEQEGYIFRAHHSAGSIPSDKGYRCYVESLGGVSLPLAEQRLVSHLFHQVEREMEEWLNLAATLMAQMVQNVAVVTLPRSEACLFKHLELVSLRESTALVIVVLGSARIRQQLITFEQSVSQTELTATAAKLNSAYSGLGSSQISAKSEELPPFEQLITDCLIKIIDDESKREYDEHYLDGLHFMLNQPEFAKNQRMSSLLELVEQRSLLKNIIPEKTVVDKVEVIIGKENKAESIQDYSVVISRYGLPKEAIGNIVVIGPTRMPYARSIATVHYLSSILNTLVAGLYGKEIPVEAGQDTAS